MHSAYSFTCLTIMMLPRALLGPKFFLYDAGYKNKYHSDALKKAIHMLTGSQSLAVVGAAISHSQPGLEHLIRETLITETKAIASANIDINKCLKSAACLELQRIPLDNLSAVVEDKELLGGLSHCFYFNRKYPLIRYGLSQKGKLSEEGEKEPHQNIKGGKQLVLNGDTEKQLVPNKDAKKKLPSKSSSTAGVDEIDDAESTIIFHIKSPLLSDYTSILITGHTPIAQIAKIDGIDNEHLSVFVVPHQESKEFLSLLPEDTRKLLSNPASLADAALHLALYHMVNRFHPSVDRLQGKMEENGKSFLDYYLNHCKPEADLAAMLQDPEAKVSPIFQSENFQLNWYKKHKQRVFLELVKAISDEEGKQLRRLSLLRDSLAWAHFYSHIRAEVYVMSAGQEPCPEVLNGIIIANLWRNTKCCIVITDSFQCSLDDVVQRDVRKLAFPNDKSEPIVHIGFLDKSTVRKDVPFFTINPWSQAQSHESQYHTVSVDTAGHSVSGLGEEPQMHLIRDELDIKEGISTSNSNAIIGHIAYSQRPSLSHVGEERRLETYLKLIGYKITFESYGLEDVLDCLLGPSLVQQLREIASTDIPGDMKEIIPVLLQQKAAGNSKFWLTPTRSAAFKADVGIHISSHRPLQVRNKTVKSAAFIVKKARTKSVDITLKVNINLRDASFEVSKYLDPKGSCGTTIADHIYSICCKEDAWFLTKGLTVGEVLHIFLKEESALLAIQSLPLFLSFPLSRCKINHYLTSVQVDSSQALQEAHICVTPFKLLPVFIKKRKFCIEIKSLTMHIFPQCDIDQSMIQIEGSCTLNKIIPMKFTCSSTPDLQKHVRFSFADTLPATEVFDLFGISVPPASLTAPVSGSSLNNELAYEGGFLLSQLQRSTEEVHFTSLFFVAVFCNVDIKCLLPPTLSHIQHAKVKTTVYFPSKATPKLGLEASFSSEFYGSDEVEGVMLECCLSVSPSITDSSYACELMVRQYRNKNEPQAFRGKSVYAIISALTGTLGRNLSDEVRKIPKVGEQLLNNVSLRKMVLQLVNTEIQALKLHATMLELDIIHSKFSLNDCTLKISYSKKAGLELECKGNLVFLQHYKYLVHFSLPTADRKGELTFRSWQNDLVFKDIVQAFDVQLNPVLAKVLDIVVRKVALDFSFAPGDGKLQIIASDISLFKEKLDISLVTFHGIEFDISTKLVKGDHVTGFSLEAYISDALHAKLKCNPGSHVLTGTVNATFSKSVSAVDVLQMFNPSASSYDNMKSILQEDFMDVFKSDLKIVTQPGLMASLIVSIRLPSRQCGQYSLEHLNLQVEDALKISCRKSSYVLNTFQFEYFNFNNKEQDSDVASTSHLSLALHKLNSKENMTLDFDFTSKQDKTSFFTAKVEAGPLGGFLKLRSVIDLASSAYPKLPNFDVGLPPIFDIELLSGSVTFVVRPSFQPSAFNINILINEWRVFGDPELTVRKLTLKTAWESGSYPELMFTDCSLTFLEHKLNISGKLSSSEVYVECRSAEKLPETGPTQFKLILKDYTPKSEPPSVLPTNIGLPPMEVEIKELIIQLMEVKKRFRVNTRVLACSPWLIRFGSHIIPVHELGGALEWEKLENKMLYKAFLYGTIELFGMQVDMEMSLGKGIDSIVVARVSHPQRLHYGQAADHLLCSEAITPYDQYNPGDSGLSELLPSTMRDISLTSASTALNVTKKQFFLSSSVQGWGTGSLLVGYLVKNGEMDYVVSLTLNEDLRFGRISDCLAFIDQLLLLRSVSVLISSTDLQNLSVLTDHLCHAFSGSQVHDRKPFYESAILGNAKLAEIQAGTTIYAEIDIARSHGGINKLLELGDNSLESDIAIMTYIGKSKTIRDLEIHAWIPRILLFEMLEFSNIHLTYRVQTASEFELSGKVALGFHMKNSKPLLEFEGKLSVNPNFAKFSTECCKDVMSHPCGIHITVNDLKLALKMYLNGESPDVYVSGRLVIGYFPLTCKFLLKGIIFKVFMIRLECGLTLSALFTCTALDWPVELDLGIKEGQFYYAASNITFEEDGSIFMYEDGYHLEAVITLLNSDFRIKAYVSSDWSNMVLSGRSVEAIDFFFAKITGARPYTHEGPELKYDHQEKSLTLTVGVEILKHPCFEGELKYMLKDKSLEGTIKYPGKFLWINEPSMKVRWSKDDGFNIVDFSLFGDVPGFSLLGAIAKYAKIIYNLITGILRWSVKLHLKTGENPNPNKHLLKLVLYGEFIITVLGFDIPVLPLPEVPILLPRIDDFSFAKLPQYILRCLWDSAGPICWSLLKYINPWNLLKKSAQLIWGGIKGAVNTVVNVTKKIGQAVADTGRAVVKTAKKIWRGFCSIFGRSAFIIDLDNGAVLGYIRGGKGGQKLCNEKYIVEQFGPILTVNAIGAMAHDVYRHFKSCVDARESSPCDEVDGEEEDETTNLKERLDELKGKTEELAENLTIEADKVLTVKEVCVKVNERNISVEWFVYNPEENVFYNNDKGDIEYHVKVAATVIESENVKQVSIYDDVFTTKGIEEESETLDKVTEDIMIFRSQMQDEIAEVTTDLSTAKASEPSTPHVVKDVLQGEEDFSSEVSLFPIAAPVQSNDAEEREEIDDQRDDDSLVEEEEQAAKRKVGDNQERKDSVTYDRQKESHTSDPLILKKRISLQVPFDPRTLDLGHTMCICASIQPTVTLEVKMLPPDKIASQEHMIDRQRLEEGDTSWMDGTKKEIEENGRVNEVTLQGQRVCVQQLVRPDSDAKVQFTAQCDHEIESITVSGDITPVPDADRYLVQLVDGADITVTIKQNQLLPPKLHYRMEAALSDFPETSSGPYYVSVIAFCADLSTCSAFTDSELKITRYCQPIGLTETLPNLDSSDSDVVRLEWKQPSGHKDAAESMAVQSDAPIIGQSDSNSLADVPLFVPHEEDHEVSPPESTALELDASPGDYHFYTVTIKGVCIKRAADLESMKREAISIDNVDSSEEAFTMSNTQQHFHKNSVWYEFSLNTILKENKYKLQGGLMFQCQVVTNGVSKLHSMPKSFADFILLAPPMDLKLTTPVRRAGLHIGWEYCAHAICYRIELVDEHNTAEKPFSKVLKRETGSHGESVLYKSDFKDIPYTSNSRNGYRLHMYSLGFGQELIRCLVPSIAEEIIRMIPAKLQYLHDSKVVRVKFKQFPDVRAEFVVALYQVTGDETDEPLYLTARHVYDHEVYSETVRDFPLKKWWHLLQSGDLIIAWIFSTVTQDCGVTYIGAPQEEVRVMDSAEIRVSPSHDSDGTISSVKLAWSEVAKAERYQYGYYLLDKKEYVGPMETRKREAVINFEGSSLEQLVCENFCQFQIYLTALGKPGEFVAGELSLDTSVFQCIKACTLEGGAIVFTSISLLQMWGNHLAGHIFSHYLVPWTLSPPHILFPSGKRFPRLSIPCKYVEKFWDTDFSLFGTGKNWLYKSCSPLNFYRKPGQNPDS